MTIARGHLSRQDQGNAHDRSIGMLAADEWKRNVRHMGLIGRTNLSVAREGRGEILGAMEFDQRGPQRPRKICCAGGDRPRTTYAFEQHPVGGEHALEPATARVAPARQAVALRTRRQDSALDALMVLEGLVEPVQLARPDHAQHDVTVVARHERGRRWISRQAAAHQRRRVSQASDAVTQPPERAAMRPSVGARPDEDECRRFWQHHGKRAHLPRSSRRQQGFRRRQCLGGRPDLDGDGLSRNPRQLKLCIPLCGR